MCVCVFVCLCFCVCVFFLCVFFLRVFFVCVWVGGSIQKYVGRRCTAFSVRRLARLFLCTLDGLQPILLPKGLFRQKRGARDSSPLLLRKPFQGLLDLLDVLLLEGRLKVEMLMAH